MAASSDQPQGEASNTPCADPISTRDEHTKVTHRLARLALAAFVFTFIARILVILIMAGELPPQLFLHVTGTHVHHLNYGITLLSITGALLIFVRPTGKALSAVAVVYGIMLGLTFDEFGMWLHLGGPYWQRASFDAVVVVAALLALIAYGSTIRHWRPKHHITIAFLLLVLGAFGYTLDYSLKWADKKVAPVLRDLEDQGPS